MWRALFLGVGLFVLVLGAECLLIDEATINNPSDDGSGPATITFHPPDFEPWILISAGAVTILYSFTLPQKFKG
ncbi:MAG TPA: hypothetical protein VGJ15_12040 [Pirellulales bacterium]